jgi:hypothetical protein
MALCIMAEADQLRTWRPSHTWWRTSLQEPLGADDDMDMSAADVAAAQDIQDAQRLCEASRQEVQLVHGFTLYLVTKQPALRTALMRDALRDTAWHFSASTHQLAARKRWA